MPRKGGKGGKGKEPAAPRGRAAKRAEEEELRQEAVQKKEEEEKKEELKKNVGAWEGDDYEMGEQDWPPYVLLKGQSYHGVGKRRAPKRDIHVDQVYLTVPGKILLRPETKFKVISGNKYGIVGRNGLGKSVLMTRLSKREEPFQHIPEYISILHVEQEIAGDDRTSLEAVLQSNQEREWLIQQEKLFARAEEDDEVQDKMLEKSYNLNDIHERMREIDAHTAEARAQKILFGLGFTNEEVRIKKTREYSGGWRMRIALACALFGEPDLLILDEPTNHLDIPAVIWLEDYLSRWKKSLLLVSHDRDFLDGVVDNIIHLHNTTLTYYKGDFQTFVKVRGNKQRELSNKRDAQLRDKKKKEKYVRENATKQSKQAKRVKKELAKAEIVEEDTDDPSLVFNFPDPDDLKDITAVISLKDVSFGYPGNKLIFKNLELGIYLDSRIGCVGPNGAGKSTLLKLIDSSHPPTKGRIEKKDHLRVARFHQHHVDQLDLEVNAIQYFQSLFDGQPFAFRQHLARFGVRGDLATQKISSLSGGQKSRVAIAELAYKRPHVLLLDEPTNHLDMETIDSLVDGIARFEGAVIIISHNQHLIEAATNELWVVSKKGSVKRFKGDFQEYKEEIMLRFEDDYVTDGESSGDEMAPPDEDDLNYE